MEKSDSIYFGQKPENGTSDKIAGSIWSMWCVNGKGNLMKYFSWKTTPSTPGWGCPSPGTPTLTWGRWSPASGTGWETTTFSRHAPREGSYNSLLVLNVTRLVHLGGSLESSNLRWQFISRMVHWWGCCSIKRRIKWTLHKATTVNILVTSFFSFQSFSLGNGPSRLWEVSWKIKMIQ